VRYYAVDRIEGRIAVLVDDGGMPLDAPRSSLPAGAREGSVLRVPIDRDGNPDWSLVEVDEAERQRRLKEARETLNRLRKRDPGGDIAL
jgi:hypothetical protein